MATHNQIRIPCFFLGLLAYYFTHIERLGQFYTLLLLLLCIVGPPGVDIMEHYKAALRSTASVKVDQDGINR